MKELPSRLPGADLLRLAAIVSIVVFHIVILDALAAHASTGDDAGRYDTILTLSTVFDNRTLAILSLYLAFIRYASLRYGQFVGARSSRLLVPYLAWTLIYPFLDLGIAALAGQPEVLLVRISDPAYWLSGFFLATTTPHLHFLITLWVLTLLLPLYSRRLPPALVVLLITGASLARVGIEVEVPALETRNGWASLGALSFGRLIESLPLGFLAYLIFVSPAPSSRAMTVLVIALAATIGAQIALSVGMFDGWENSISVWTFLQAGLGALAMSLAVCFTLSLGARLESAKNAELFTEAGEWLSRHGLGVFLIHPFVVKAFEVLVDHGPQEGLVWLLPKSIIVLAVSLLITTLMLLNRWSARIV